jgi:hypothetical protein
MKTNLFLSIICISLVCCKKDNTSKPDVLLYQHEVLTFLKDSLSSKDFSSLALDKQIWGRQKNAVKKYIKFLFYLVNNLKNTSLSQAHNK